MEPVQLNKESLNTVTEKIVQNTIVIEKASTVVQNLDEFVERIEALEAKVGDGYSGNGSSSGSSSGSSAQVDVDLSGYVKTSTLANYVKTSDLDAYVTKTDVQTLQNKTLDAPFIATIKNGDAVLTLPTTTGIIATTADIVTAQTGGSVDLSDYVTKDALGTYITEDSTDTLKNKTLMEPTIAKIKNGSNTLTVPSKTGTLATIADIPSAPDLSGYALKTEIPSAPDLSSYVTKTGEQTLTNKTLTEPKIAKIKNGNYTLTLSSKTGTLATTDDIPATSSTDMSSYVTKTGTETLTNKTLTTPTIEKIKVGSNTLTLPTGADTTLVGLSSTQTLTNKTLTTPTISSIKNGNDVVINLPSKSGTIALTSDIPDTSSSSSSSSDNTDYDNSLEAQVLYLSARLETALKYLATKSTTRNIVTICDEVTGAATFNRGSK